MSARNSIWILLGLLLVLFYVASSSIELIVEYIWFHTQDYGQVFAVTIGTKLALGLVAGAASFVFLAINVMVAVRELGDPARYLPAELQHTPMGQLLTPRTIKRVGLLGSLAIGALAGFSGSNGWESWLLFLNGGSFGAVEPIFGKDIGFYVFRLPFIDQVQSFAWSLGILALFAVGLLYFLKMQADRPDIGPARTINLASFSANARRHVAVLAALLLLDLAVGVYLQRFELLHQPGGLFTGPGYAEINGALPMLALKSVAAVVAAFIVVYALLRQRYRFLLGGVALMLVVWIGANIYTTVLQRFIVAPNELEKERPFLGFHIEATNRAFGLDTVEERTLARDTELTTQDITNNRATVHNVRLWDHEPLLDTFSQIQEIRTYYEFVSVDNDRYMIDGELRQTMLSPRELSSRSLPSRTWVNERLTFTHGYGLTMGPVNRVNEQGLPALFVQDLPPRTVKPELSITRPEIYYGEIDNDYVFVRTRQKEFNYPEGDLNIFSDYEGDGGVPMGSLWRRLLFAAYFRDIKVLLAEDFTDQTRVMLFRNIFKRVTMIAPFFKFDQDPYMVIHAGKLMWIMDGYTTSSRYPYSEAVQDVGNYIRNPVKAVVDAYDGSIRFYLVGPTDPIAQAYQRIFPGLIHALSEMPAGLRAHLRHPPDFFNIQTQMYATYHMRDVNTFYNKEDQWEVPVIEQKRMEPYYTVMRLPEEAKEEFILMLPFTPRLKDNMAAWMVGRSDGDHYGKLVVYAFPKQKLIFGPKQMAARINQDPQVSQQITLWDQSGSNVIRGTLLVIPIENSLVYIQPLYLRAEDGRIPELKRVIVGYQNSIAMGLDLDDALRKIFGSDGRPTETSATRAAAQQRATEMSSASPMGVESGSARAMQHYEAMQRASREGDWSRFGRELEELGKTLRELQTRKP
ncbi:MAG: UPF0182 family protein [Candidatus Lambdaproteobacteria bacterium]|nr:UPF0182 family protein [Candidatus Lambdaproteobacteria bacterium]